MARRTEKEDAGHLQSSIPHSTDSGIHSNEPDGQPTQAPRPRPPPLPSRTTRASTSAQSAIPAPPNASTSNARTTKPTPKPQSKGKGRAYPARGLFPKTDRSPTRDELLSALDDPLLASEENNVVQKLRRSARDPRYAGPSAPLPVSLHATITNGDGIHNTTANAARPATPESGDKNKGKGKQRAVLEEAESPTPASAISARVFPTSKPVTNTDLLAQLDARSQKSDGDEEEDEGEDEDNEAEDEFDETTSEASRRELYPEEEYEEGYPDEAGPHYPGDFDYIQSDAPPLPPAGYHEDVYEAEEQDDDEDGEYELAYPDFTVPHYPTNIQADAEEEEQHDIEGEVYEEEEENDENAPPPRREGGRVPFAVYRDDEHEDEAEEYVEKEENIEEEPEPSSCDCLPGFCTHPRSLPPSSLPRPTTRPRTTIALSPLRHYTENPSAQTAAPLTRSYIDHVTAQLYAEQRALRLQMMENEKAIKNRLYALEMLSADAAEAVEGVNEALRALEDVAGSDMATVVKWMVNEIPYMKPSDYKEGMGVAWLKDYLESHAPEDDDEDAPAEGHGGDGGDGGDDDDDDDDDDEEGGPDTMNMRAGHVQVLSTIQEVDEEAITAYREAQFSTPTPSPQPQAQDEPGSTARVELNPLKRRRSDVDEVAPRPAPVVQQEQELEDAMDTDEEEEISMILTAAIQHDEDSEDEEEHPSKKMRMTSEIEEATSASAARAVRGSPNVAAEERKVSGTTVYSVSVDGYRSGSENPENAREQVEELVNVNDEEETNEEHEERNEKENKTGIASEAPVASSTHVEHAQTMYENDSNGVNSTSYLNYHEERLEAGREEQEPRTISIPPSASAFAIRESAPSPSPHLTLQDDQTQDGAQPLSRGGRALSGLPPLAPGEYRAVQSSYLDRFLGVVGVRRYSQPENQANASPSSEELTLTSALVSIGALPPQAMERAMGQTTRYGPVAQGAPEGRQTRSRTRASPGERERIAEETRARKRAEAIERGSALGVAQSAVFGSVVRPAVPANSRPLRRSNAMVVPQEAPQARPRRGASQLQRQETVASIPESASRGPRPLVRSFEHVYEVKRPLSNQQAREAKFADLETPEMSRERIRMVRTGRSPSRSPSRRSRSPRVIRMVAGVVVGETPAEEANAEAESDDDDVVESLGGRT